MERVEILQVAGGSRLEQAFLIRRRVFVEEQKVPAEFEFDGKDATALHLLASADGRSLGTLRIRFPEALGAKIERVAVLSEARGLGVGRRLILRALDLAREAGAAEARLHAQVQARHFYERLGFEATGARFIEDGIPHVLMRRPLQRGTGASAA